MIRRRVLTAVVVVMITVGVLSCAAYHGEAYAAQTATVGGNALKVSPVRTDVSMDPGTSKTLEVFITNVTSVPATLHIAINDFISAADESGTPNVILDENQFAPSHSFKQFVKPLGNITLAPGEQRNVKVVINLPKDAAGGGYYGAVRFAPANVGNGSSLNLAASVGSLVLLKVNGEITERLNVASFDVRKKNQVGSFFTDNKNLTNVMRFQNIGNVQVAPFGSVTLKRFGKVVSKIEINNVDPRGNVLPDSVRRFTLPLNKLSSFGRYTLQGNFGYGTTGQLLTAKATFYVIPVPLIGIVVGSVLALVILVVVLPRMIRSYNRRIIRKASRRR